MSNLTTHIIKSFDGTNIFIRTWGDRARPPIVLVHGLDHNSIVWSSLAMFLADYFYLIAPDLRGNGFSDSSSSNNYTPEALITDLRVVLDTMNFDKVTLVGHSMGGKISMLFTADFPQLVDKLILVDSAPVIKDNIWNFLRNSLISKSKYASKKDYIRELRSTYLWCPDQDLINLSDTNLMRCDDGWEKRIDELFVDGVLNQKGILRDQGIWKTLALLQRPLLLIKGELSSVVTGDLIESMRRQLPSMRTMQIPKASHSVMFDQPQLLSNAIQLFLLLH